MKDVCSRLLMVMLAASASLFFVTVAILSSPKKGKAASSASVSKGEAVFKQQCALCHKADSTAKKVGPGLKGLFQRKELASNHKAVTEENVREQIENGAPDTKPFPMPAFKDKLKPEEIDDLIAYLKTL